MAGANLNAEDDITTPVAADLSAVTYTPNRARAARHRNTGAPERDGFVVGGGVRMDIKKNAGKLYACTYYHHEFPVVIRGCWVPPGAFVT